MKNLSFLTCSLIWLLWPGYSQANNDKDSVAIRLQHYFKLVDSVNKALHYQSGTVQLGDHIAELHVPSGFKYLNVEQSRYVIEKLWGNLPQDNLQGMLFPKDGTPFTSESYAFIISYEDIGYVKDDDAEKINYDEMMADMKKDEVDVNKKRLAAGVAALFTNGWASRPYYDKDNKVLHWAISIREEGTDENTLNYKVILLGRKGILSMNAVAPLSALDSVKKHINEVVAIPHFTEGNKYSDYTSGIDKVAVYTIGGLVAGKVLAKVGLLAILGKFLLAAWKFIAIGFVALGAAVKKFFRRGGDDGPLMMGEGMNETA